MFQFDGTRRVLYSPHPVKVAAGSSFQLWKYQVVGVGYNAPVLISPAGTAMPHRRTIYADYQATTPTDPRVVEAMAPYWNGQFGNPHSSDHVVGWNAAKVVSSAAEDVARLLGADADEVIFTSGATEANNLALLGLAERAPLGRNRILVSAIEHKCVLAATRALAEQKGLVIEKIPVSESGHIDLLELEAMLDDSVLVVSIMAVNNEIGTIQNLPEVAAAIKSRNILFHCDAAQAPCAIDNTYNISDFSDLASLSGHKIYGPQGIGALYVRREVQDELEPMIYGGGQQNGLRSGTVPVALCAGLAAASEIMDSDDAVKERKRVASLRDKFLQLLENSDFPIEANGPDNRYRHPGNASLRFPGIDAHDLLNALQPEVAASSGAACASGTPESSHVLDAIGLNESESASSIRFSFGRFTTEEDVEQAAAAVIDKLESLTPVPLRVV